MDGDVRVPGELAAHGPELGGFVGGLDYSMLVVTARHGSVRAGCLVGFATQTSIDPWRLLVCLSRSNMTTRVAVAAGVLAVHRLRADQIELARLFGEQSGEWLDKFQHCAWRDGERGVPVLTDCPGWLIGEVVSVDDVGDHAGVLIAAVAAGSTDGGGGGSAEPMTFQRLPELRPGHDA